MKHGRFHPLMALRFLRKTLAVYLLPLINILFERNWPALRDALMQDLFIFALLCAVSWVILHVSSWSLDEENTFCLHWKLFVALDREIRGSALAGLTLERPLLFRLCGASRLVLYPIGQPKKGTLSLCLRQDNAQELADRLFPIEKPVLHTPHSGEKVALVLLGANGVSTLALIALALRQTRGLPWDPQTAAFSHLNSLAAFAARWLPAGTAWLLVLAGAFWSTSLLRSFAQTLRYTVWRTEDQLGSRGGWLNRYEFRVRRSQLSFADVRLSPGARLLHRWPVFVTAGCCCPELPFFVYRSGEEAMFAELLPEFRMPPEILPDTRKRSLLFFAPAGVPFAFFLLLVLVSRYTLPALTPLLLIPAMVFLVLLSGGYMGYRQEGIWPQDGLLTLRRQERLSLHCICILHPDLCLKAMQSPWAVQARRLSLTITLPGQVRLKVRSIPEADAEQCFNP